jgi:hypothetical protein
VPKLQGAAWLPIFFFVGALPLSLFYLLFLTVSASKRQSRFTKGQAPTGFEKSVPLVSLLSLG